MKFGSVCSGIEAASVAWEPLGWQAAWFAEIDAFPSAVLAHHWPQVVNLGDMTAIASMVANDNVEAPDVLVGGTPCQAFSVAGARKSLNDDRGQLSLEYIKLANSIDEKRKSKNQQPSIIVWENVPGVLNTKDNAFGCFLGALAGESDQLLAPGGRWSNAGLVFGPQRAIAWRVLDAQYFGVAQRRRRVFVVASARNGFNPAKVLFEWESVRRDSAPSRSAGQETAGGVGEGIANAGRVIGTLCARDVKGVGNQYVSEGKLILPSDTPKYWNGGQLAGTLTKCGMNQLMPDKNNAQLVVVPQYAKGGEICDTVTTKWAKGSGGPAGSETGNLVIHGTQDPIIQDNQAFPLGRNHGQENAIFGIPGNWIGHKPESGGNAVEPMNNIAPCQTETDRHAVAVTDCAGTLTLGFGARGVDSDQIANGNCAINNNRVRRLTPVECERLQGFPDNWTKIPYRGKPTDQCPDGPRYAACGNSMAVPVMAWIGQRIMREVRNA